MIFEFVCAFSLGLLGLSTSEYIKKVQKDPESKWSKFWNLYNNVQDEYKKKKLLKPILQLLSFYKTVKIVVISDIEKFVNSHLMKLMKPIELKNNKFLVPVFLHDNKYYIVIEKNSEVRKYDIIGITPNKHYNIQNIFNHTIALSTSPYALSFATPIDLNMDFIQMTIIKNDEIDINKFSNNEQIQF
jgi:hypothetical protein